MNTEWPRTNDIDLVHNKYLIVHNILKYLILILMFRRIILQCLGRLAPSLERMLLMPSPRWQGIIIKIYKATGQIKCVISYLLLPNLIESEKPTKT